MSTPIARSVNNLINLNFEVISLILRNFSHSSRVFYLKNDHRPFPSAKIPRISEKSLVIIREIQIMLIQRWLIMQEQSNRFVVVPALFFRKKKYPKLGIGILINDIGTVCSSSGCQTQRVPTRTAFALPDTYQAILDELGIQKEELVVFWEKHIRNETIKVHNKKQNPTIRAC